MFNLFSTPELKTRPFWGPQKPIDTKSKITILASRRFLLAYILLRRTTRKEKNMCGDNERKTKTYEVEKQTHKYTKMTYPKMRPK